MAFDEREMKRHVRAIEAFLARRRPPVHLRNEVDLGFRIVRHSVEIFEIRPDWRDRVTPRETPVAKATYVRSRNHWRLFWMRRDLKWHAYEPSGPLRSLAAVLDQVEADKYGCFFG